jgi:hypothetical protein
VRRPEVFFDWIQAQDLYGIDAMLANLFEFRSGHLDSTRSIDPATWRLLEKGSQTWDTLGFEKVDYPRMIELFATRHTGAQRDDLVASETR